MSAVMGIVRNAADIAVAIEENGSMSESHKIAGIEGIGDLLAFLKNEDLLITERAFLESAQKLLKTLRGFRGSFIVGRIDEIVNKYRESADRGIRVDLDESSGDTIIEFAYDDNLKGKIRRLKARPVPSREVWFEDAWRDFREGKIYE
jgi:hypothetical protein